MERQRAAQRTIAALSVMLDPDVTKSALRKLAPLLSETELLRMYEPIRNRRVAAWLRWIAVTQEKPQ